LRETVAEGQRVVEVENEERPGDLTGDNRDPSSVGLDSEELGEFLVRRPAKLVLFPAREVGLFRRRLERDDRVPGVGVLPDKGRENPAVERQR
jgi:hypothetical protein